MTGNAASEGLVSLTADIVSAYVTRNNVPAGDLPSLIAGVHQSLAALGKEAQPETPALEPAVPVRKSVTPDYIVCLEDGKKFKSLRRHLGVHYGLTPDEYRAKWGLPRDYPMVAPNYAAARSALAKTMGLGRKPKAPKPAPAPAKKSRSRAAKAG
ncbi:MAG: MucR family transcriptional regulator [Rhizobiales bacterium]|nr:MucR family transcriptional regulator [Hyphomicrobiales bacterium]OJU33058.1 MAG: MucR family transcriptional regulator [Rhizobiales bacterium 68-8]